MDRTADLDAAIKFVMGRIAEEAKLAGEPLSDEQLLLLKHLPSGTQSPDLEMPVLVPRNINLERVCALARTTYEYDRHTNPGSSDWEYAFAVFALHRHPMRGLLQLSGMKFARPRGDLYALIVTTLVPLCIVVLVVMNNGSRPRSILISSAGVVVMLLMFFAFRRFEKQRLKDEIERCRPNSRSRTLFG